MPLIPVSGSDILFPDGARTVLNDNKPAVFLPNWRATDAYSGLAPLCILLFRSDAGEEGVWFLDAQLNRCAGMLGDLPAPLLADLMDALCPLLDGIWQASVAAGGRVRPLTNAEQDFLSLPTGCREPLIELYLQALAPVTAVRSFERPGDGLPHVPALRCGQRTVPLRLHGLHSLFDPGLLQREQRRLIADGFMELPSPVDGRLLRCDRSLVLDTDLIAYRLHDPVWDLSAFVLAGEIYFRTMAVFVPDADLVLAADADGFRAARPDLGRLMRRHALQHAPQLFAYLAAERTGPLHVWRGRTAMHLGHVLWNDLSGIAGLVDSLPAASLPPFLVCDSGAQPEMYGPLDRVFPELSGKVLRRPEPFTALVDSFYDTGVCVFRSSGMQVTRALRDRIAAPARRADRPVILLGLRTENRTLDDLPGFCRALVAHLAHAVGRAVLVVDGHNRSEANEHGGGSMIWSHGELEADASPVDAELQLLDVIRAAAHGTGIEVVSTIGEPVAESVAWGRAAGFFVSFWGAGLAKYRWVCNCPGLVLTNRWNLGNLGDLHIYSRPDMMDEPTPLVFVPPDAVRDLLNSRLLVRHEGEFVPSLCNFEIDVAAVLGLVDEMVRAHLPEAGTAPAAPAVSRPERKSAPKRTPAVSATASSQSAGRPRA